MVDRTMTGSHPVLQIPYDPDGNIDEEDLRREVEWAIDCGSDGVAIALGSSVIHLIETEREYVLKTVVDQTRGRIKVCMNTGAQSTNVAVHWSKRAADLGADSLMVWQPTQHPTGTEETVGYFRAVANATDLPIFIQDTLSSPCPPPLAVRLAAEHENLCYIKVETAPTPVHMTELMRLGADTGLIMFGGYSGFFVVEEFRRGSVGTMPSCILPDAFAEIWRRWRKGDERGAEEEYHRIEGLLRATEQMPQGLFNSLYRELLVRRGIFKCAYARGPVCRAEPDHLKELEHQMEIAGVAKANV